MVSQNKKTNRTIEIINPARFFKSYRDYNEGKTNIAEISNKDFLFREFETRPLDGYQPQDLFPSCCAYHQGIYENAKKLLDDFPMCCKSHGKLTHQPWFNKLDYAYLPEKVSNTLAYTNHCIEACHNSENWYKEITDYIAYTVDSYGQFPEGFGPPVGLSSYLGYLESAIAEMNAVPEEKRTKLLEYLERYTDPGKEQRSPDLNELIDIYKQWLRVFPFNVGYLGHLRSYYQKQLPVLRRGSVDKNIYTGIISFGLISKKELLKILTDTTADILRKVNAMEAHKKGLLGNHSDTAVELLNARHALRMESLTLKGKESDREYIKTLKRWLKYEREYISELAPLLENDFSTQTFILNIIDGMKLLQSGDTNVDCIATVRNGGGNRESKFRYWFRDFLYGRYKGSTVTAEEENGPGKMDLKIYQERLGTKVIEFKGWWNHDKGGASNQLINYLTDFEPEGYVFMINHLKNKDITESYKKLVEDTENYIPDSWTEHKIPNSDLFYYESKHKSAIKEKTIYHFLFNVNF